MSHLGKVKLGLGIYMYIYIYNNVGEKKEKLCSKKFLNGNIQCFYCLLFLFNNDILIWKASCLFEYPLWRGGCPRDVTVKAMDCGIVVSEFELQFTNGQTPLGKIWTLLSSQVWVKLYHYCSSRKKALALNNQQRLIFKQTNQTFMTRRKL